MLRRLLMFAAVAWSAAQVAAANLEVEAPANWHRFRGPDATGVAPHADPPLTWDGETNIAWKVPIEGRGLASPIVWGDRVYLLTAVDTGRPGEPVAHDPAARDAEEEHDDEDDDDEDDDDRERRSHNIHQMKVICLDRRTGDRVWERVATETTPHERLHGTNTFASASPTTDGERLYASFGSLGILCYDLDGRPLWDIDLGDMETENEFGEGASPTIHDGTLIVNWDHNGETDGVSQSFIVALDAATGDEKWRQARDEMTSWNTPLVVEGGGRTQVVVNGATAARGYDLATGEVLWECGGQTKLAIASPVALGEVAYCMTGFRGNAVYAIPLDARGVITDTDKIRWHTDKAGPYVPSPILYGDRLYFTKSSKSIVSCVDAHTGEPLWDQLRIPGLDDQYASPVGAAGKIYFTGRDGVTVVIRHGDELEVLATNNLGEPVDATPALVGRAIYIRGHEHLYCIGEP